MKKRMIALLMGLILVLGNCLSVFALEPPPYSSVTDEKAFTDWIRTSEDDNFEYFLNRARQLESILSVQSKSEYNLTEIGVYGYNSDMAMYIFDNGNDRILFHIYLPDEERTIEIESDYSEEIVNINGIDTTVYYVNGSENQQLHFMFELDGYLISVMGGYGFRSEPWDSAYLDWFEFSYLSLEEPEIMIGDANADEIINADDALETLRTAAGMNDVSMESYLRQDINEDYSINATDALNMLKYSAKLVDTFEKSDEFYAARIRNSSEKLFFEEERYTQENIDAYNSFVGENMIALQEGSVLSPEFISYLQGDTEGIDESLVFTESAMISKGGELYICLFTDNEKSRLTNMYVINLSGDTYTAEIVQIMKKGEKTVVFVAEDGEGFVETLSAKVYCKGYILSSVIGKMKLDYSLSAAVYPEAVAYADYFTDKNQYNAWETDKNSKALYYTNEADEALDSFIRNTASEILCQNERKNLVYSPINLYMALSMLSEVTAGNSRAQLLALSGAGTIEEQRSEANALWQAHYRDDGIITSILGNSVWLSDNIDYNMKTLNTLSSKYYASTYSGEMGTEAYNQELRDWLNEQTKGLLGDAAKNVEMSSDTVLALASTIYFKGAWQNKFSKNQTEEGIFYSDDKEITCEFMNKKREEYTYYRGDDFGAIKEGLDSSGAMWFIRPDDDSSVYDILESEQFTDFILSNGNWENQKKYFVNFKLPKFDVSSDLKLKENLRNLGVTDILEFETSDFSPLCDINERIRLSSLQHAARVTIDEEGCIAAAFTVAMAEADSMPMWEEMDFVLDKPFIFVITSEHGAPLFIGVVNNPS